MLLVVRDQFAAHARV